jgi:hypothetical protein
LKCHTINPSFSSVAHCAQQEDARQTQYRGSGRGAEAKAWRGEIGKITGAWEGVGVGVRVGVGRRAGGGTGAGQK